MITKTSIRYFNKIPVRARWDEENSIWLYSATDIIRVLYPGVDYRRYWNTFKKRHNELQDYVYKMKMTSSDHKSYLTDCISIECINYLITILPKVDTSLFNKWIKGLSDPLDEQSKIRAYELYDNNLLNDIEIGTIEGLKQIHGYLFDGLYTHAGKIRDRNISKDGFIFANYQYFDEILKNIENMKDDTVNDIIDKYVELNIAHPFLEGNGRAGRIWINQLLINRVNKAVDWQKISKEDYLYAMRKSPTDTNKIKRLIKSALTDNYDSKSFFMKGIDYSYYYEDVD